MLKIFETYIDQDKGHIFGESGWYTPYTEDKGRLFRSLQQEYGRCTGKVYTETSLGDVPAGWVFEKRIEYDDARPSWPKEKREYVREVWVQLRTIPCDD